MRPSHVTDRECDRVLTFMVSMAQMLMLPPYTFVIMEEPADDGHEASISPVNNRWAACLHLGVEWMDRDEHDRMKTCVHEAVHLVHRECDEIFAETRHYMGPRIHLSLCRSWDRHVELMVDHMTQLFAELPIVREAWLNA